MHQTNGYMVYSPSDLIRFLESPFASWMERLHLECPERVHPDQPTEEQLLIAKTGNQHEQRFLEQLKKERRDVCEIAKGPAAAVHTLQAIEAGREVIYQAFLSRDGFQGYTDFLVKLPGDRPLYEVWDTKLAHAVKPYYLVQLCGYSEMLAAIQGQMPTHTSVVLGNGEHKPFRVEDFLYYYRRLRQAFLAQMEVFDPSGQPPIPEPRDNHRRWQSHADRILLETDHLAQVAGINTSQMKKLAANGITTVAALARSQGKRVPKMSEDVLKKLVEQAELQVQTRELRAKAKADELVRPVFKLIQPEPDSPRRGLEQLPPPSPLDVYFDMEGYPLHEDGLEYLFGAVCHDRIGEGGKLEFHDWWGHDRAGEKAAFEGFIDWVCARWNRDPKMHIYHYADYERAALRRLACRHATRELEVDELQRNRVLVDLYQVVRQGLRVGEPSYSIKSIELLYREKRASDVKTAGESVVYYANWIESRQPRDWRQAELLKKIRDYNEDDCQSTHQLVDWLRQVQKQNGIAYLTPTKDEAEVTEKKQEMLAELAELRKQLEAKLAGCAPGSPEAGITALLADLIEFHRRESKPGWWRLFDWLEDKTPGEREADLNSLEGLWLSGAAPVKEKRSWIYTYQFDPDSETKIRLGDGVKLDHINLPSAMVAEMDAKTGLVKLKISQQELTKRLNGDMPHSTAIFLHEDIKTGPLDTAIRELAQNWATRGTLPAALHRFLLRQPPQIPGVTPGHSLAQPGEPAAEAALRVVQTMRNSTLCIQGPPGTGKTTTAARIIASLLKAGKKVGITSNSHKAIQNLLRAAGRETQGTLIGVYAGKGDEEAAESAKAELKTDCPRLVVVKGGSDAVAVYSAGVFAGTAWPFASDDMQGRLDYLFVDEAGQLSLAKLVAVSRSAANIVLMGDQMQLEQPVQGTHPGESGQSPLNYYLQKHATIPESLGIFLGVSYRMHPEICQFVSKMAYEGRLTAAEANKNQRLTLPPAGGKHVTKEAGIVFSPVEHEGNTQGSNEEVARILEIVRELLGRTLTDRNGQTRPLALVDILFVAPYNLQVRKLQQALPAAQVGSVDKFQGQEAPVVIVSMCSSAGEFGSRGLDFLLDKNRMNVAISRAKTLAIVVGDPRIATTEASNIEQMEKLNLFCKLE
ncbi:MAG: TM0106 family RecB-like putative nuclease [Verrucomicrobiota bacterium]